MTTVQLNSGIGLATPAKARLISTNTQQELRATSVTLSVISAVQEFAETLLRPLGAPVNQRSTIDCYVEPRFDDKRVKDIKQRPDALIHVSYGQKTWTALIEAKAGKQTLDSQQVENYLDIARALKIDCVITISNQFVCSPEYSAVSVHGNKTRSVQLFHWSWSFLQTEAKIQIGQSAISDPDQVYILDEYVRFLDDEKSGVDKFRQMSKDWVETVKTVNQGDSLSKSGGIPEAVITNWNELIRSASFRLSESLQKNVAIHLTPSERQSPAARMKADISLLCDDNELRSTLKIPSAASHIEVMANVQRRSLLVFMDLRAPKDKKRATACINWLTRQLKDSTSDNISIVANWPGRLSATTSTLAAAIDDPTVLISEQQAGKLPTSFRVRLTKDLGRTFQQAQKFPIALEEAVLEFYEAAGQNLVAWVATPPKIKNRDESHNEDNDE